MLEGIYLGVSVVFPLVFYMGIGAFVKRAGWAGTRTFDEMNRIVFRIFLAFLVFMNAYTIDLYTIFTKENMQLLVLSFGSIAVILTISAAAAAKFIKDSMRRAVIVQGIFRSNLVLYGIPISLAVYGEGNQGAVTILVAIIVPLYNILGAVLLSSVERQKASVGVMIKSVVMNPLVMSALLGLALTAARINIPSVLLSAVDKASKVATPLAFVVIGGSLVLGNFKKDWKAIAVVSTIRLIVIPGIILPIAIWLGMRTYSLIALLGVFASPISVSSYTMAKDKNIAAELAGELVAATTLISILTVFGWITVLSYFGLVT